jgi:hypothetical protein
VSQNPGIFRVNIKTQAKEEIATQKHLSNAHQVVIPSAKPPVKGDAPLKRCTGIEMRDRVN